MGARQTAGYSLGSSGEYVIENYNVAKPFSSFLPGIAGPHGIPMWVFYVNRGQCVCSMGLEGKEQPIMEFLSANRAYQLASTQGFRTFVKLPGRAGPAVYEPFQNRLSTGRMKCTQRMIIRPASLTIEEDNRTLGLRFAADYFNIPEDVYGGLVRSLRIENTGTKPVQLEVLDGLPLIIPFGVDNHNLKHMRRLVESFVEVVESRQGAPCFKVRVQQEDRPEVVRVEKGNFYVGYMDGAKAGDLVDVVVDPQRVFGCQTGYDHPECFISRTPFTVTGAQIRENRLPCAMGSFRVNLKAGESATYRSILGQTQSLVALNRLVPRISRPGYVARRRADSERIVEQLTQNSFVKSSSMELDLYARQNFLDNVLRGGFPVSLGGDGKVSTVHLYSRKHGDLERDYNDYQLSPTFYSQGNGNFRDVNQNRRNDLFINPDVGAGNVRHFYNLLQLDGFNPLIIKPTTFRIKSKKALKILLRRCVRPHHAKALLPVFENAFTPGEVLMRVAEKGIKPTVAPDVFIGEILAISTRCEEAEHGHGYWSDHWHYNLDLLENYLAVFPERLRHILLEDQGFTYFDNAHVVAPRDDKFVIWDGLKMQLDGVYVDRDKEARIAARSGDRNNVRTADGLGDVYRTTLAEKLIALIAVKLASLDPFGVGVEMESDRPNWYDALNGLPGLHGSSLSETVELKRHIQFLSDSIRDLILEDDDSITVCREVGEFVEALARILDEDTHGGIRKRDFQFWDRTASAKEAFRARVRFGVDGEQTALEVGFIRTFLGRALARVERGIRKVWRRDDHVPPTYFINDVTSHEVILSASDNGKTRPKTNDRGMTCYRARRFKQRALPSFLEGPVHLLRVETDPARAKSLSQAVRRSGLYDKKLGMYKVNASLAKEPFEIGRTRTFSPGWLENESIWMHMEYKYMLELLRSGQARRFYDTFAKALVPFMDPEVYGRSILENSSFIASSANPDPDIHGNGFVARLSGSTAEFVHILLMMCAGPQPFRMEEGRLVLALAPCLPAWLFTEREHRERMWSGTRTREVVLAENTFSFMFLGSILVTYHNPARRNTFGRHAVRPVSVRITDGSGKTVRLDEGSIAGRWAKEIRNRRVRRLDIDLA